MHGKDSEQHDIVKGYYRRLQSIMEKAKLFSRPNCRIKYQFLLFKKGPNGRYDFLLKNVRELTKKHTGVLEKVLELIQKEIPGRFGLLLPGEKNYENFYSYTELGKLFSIVTEFLHPTTRLETFAYLYKQRIMLEELIYSSNLTTSDDNPFFSMKKFEYPIKNFNLTENDDEFTDENLDDNTPRTFQNGGANINLTDVTIVFCNLVSSFDVEIIYKDKSGQFWRLVLQANLRQLEELKAKTYLLPKLKEFVHSSELETMYLPKIANLSIYEVKEHQNISTNIFKKSSSLPLWNFPVIRHTQLFAYPYQEEYPENIEKIQKTALSILKSEKKEKYDDVEITIGQSQITASDNYHVFQFGEYLVVAVTHSNKSSSTIWIINKSKPRLMSLLDLQDPKLLPFIIQLLIRYKIYDPKRHSVYTHLYAGYTLNQLHLKIYESSYYESPSYKKDVSQSTETRSYLINNVINNMAIKPDYYSSASSTFFPFYGRFLLQFIQ
jgi:hypothetical protein